MTGFCPHCEKERELEATRQQKVYEIRGEKIEVGEEVFRCATCENEFEILDHQADPIDAAFREYRRRKGMVQPEQIREFRSRIGLSQRELSELLGWGGATLSRYENGALQDQAHDKALRLAMEPRNLVKLISEQSRNVSPEKIEELLSKLHDEVKEGELPIRSLYERRFGNYEPDEFSGYKRLDIEKLFNSILFFCSKPGVVKTKLNKLLFYADFGHFRQYLISITGARYAHLPYGPAPDRYTFYIAALHEEEEAIEIEERYFNDNPGELLLGLKAADFSAFTPSEAKILNEIRNRFEAYSAKQLSEISHQEKGYLETSSGDLISYDYSESLRI